MADPTDTESLSEAAKINAQIKEIIDQTRMSLDDFNEGLKERERLESEYNRLLERRSKIQAKETAVSREITSQNEKKRQLESEIAVLESKKTDDLLENLELNNKIIEARGEIKKIEGKILDLANENIENDKLKQRLNEELNKSQKKQLENAEKYTDELKEQLETSKDIFDVMGKHAKKIPVIGEALAKALDVRGNIQDVAEGLGDMGEAIGGKLGETLARGGKLIAEKMKGISTSALMANLAVIGLVAKLAHLGSEVNSLSKELGAATGFGDQFNNEISQMGAAGNMAGIGFKESAAAIKSLANGLSSFNPNAEETNMHMGMTVARLEKLGVSSASSVKTMEYMQRSMGMTGKQAADATAQIARMGKEIGITGTKMIEDFNSASGRLAIYGKNNIKVFKELAAAAKASGIEMQTLIGISEKFDKFDSAADSAAQLNAVLGTQLSTLEMMQATDSERIMMLKQQVQMSVGNFDSLDKYTKQYIAHAMGVKDVAEAQKLLNMSTAEYQKYQQGQKELADIQKEMADATESLVPIMQQLKLAAMQFFIAFEPIIAAFAGFLALLSPIVAWFADWITYLTPAITFLGSLAVIIAKLVAGGSALAAALNPITAGILLLIGAVTWLYQIFGKRINPVFVQIFHFLANGLTMMMAPLKYVIDGVGKLGSKFASFFGVAKKGAAEFVNKDSFNIQTLATMDTDKLSAGISKVKSALMELSTLKVDGFLAMTSDGNSSSFIMGSEGVLKSISEGKLTVDVKMPEMTMPDVSVKVYIGDRELRDIIKFEADLIVNKKIGRGG